MVDIVIWEPITSLTTAMATNLAAAGFTTTRATSFIDLNTTDADVVIAHVRDRTELFRLPPRRARVIALLEPSLGLPPELVIALGANAALDRGATGHQIAAAVNAVNAGMTVIDPALRTPINATRAAAFSSLDDDQLTWLQRFADNATITDVATSSGHSERTLSRRLNDLYRQLSVTSLVEALTLAAAVGVINPFGTRRDPTGEASDQTIARSTAPARSSTARVGA